MKVMQIYEEDITGQLGRQVCRLMARTQIFKLGCNHEDIYQYFQLLKIELFVFDL